MRHDLGIFALAQPQFAAHNIATFPLRENKVPAIRGYNRVGLPASRQLAEKFPDAAVLGFMCGRRSKITVLDVDTTDENVLADALSRHGQTPIVVRTASGKFHAYYQHAAERRRIRPWRERPIDVLGANGLAIAPPSSTAVGVYQIVEGSLDDLDRLPVMRGLDEAFYARPTKPTPSRSAEKPKKIPTGRRNTALFEHCMRAAPSCDGFDALLSVADSFNMTCAPPLEADEVVRVATNAWRYTHTGRNRFRQHGAWFPSAECNELTAPGNQDVAILLLYLRAQNGPDATFLIANALAETLGWWRLRFAKARKLLIELGYVREVRPPSSGYGPALYRWT
jgi:Bifunctional DNA primase/polymerase, N-terminal